MRSHGPLVLLILLISSVQAVFAAPPCKTPDELRAAFQACLIARDTNQFWKLHCWQGVSPGEEKMHKSLMKELVRPAAQKPPRCTTSLRAAPDYCNKPKPLSKGRFIKPNIPVTGLIAYTQIFEDMQADDCIELGKGPDGNYWLVVPVLIGNTNAPSQ